MRFYKYIEETTVVGDVEKNLAKGEVDVIGAPKYKKKKKKTRLDRRPIVVHETSVSSAVVGSRQTRVWSDDNDQEIAVLKRQPRPLKFMERVGAYLPPDEEENVDEVTETAPDEEKWLTGKERSKHPYALKVAMIKRRKAGKDKYKGKPPVKEGYIKEDYFEVSVDIKGKVEFIEISGDVAKNIKQAKKEAVHMLNKDYGKGKYHILNIKRERGNPGTYQGRQEKKKSRYDVDWE